MNYEERGKNPFSAFQHIAVSYETAKDLAGFQRRCFNYRRYIMLTDSSRMLPKLNSRVLQHTNLIDRTEENLVRYHNANRTCSLTSVVTVGLNYRPMGLPAELKAPELTV
jgi:hypothetical protein